MSGGSVNEKPANCPFPKRTRPQIIRMSSTRPGGSTMTLEQLEARRLMSVSAHMHRSDLFIHGTANPDHITLRFIHDNLDDDTIAQVESNGKVIWGLARGNNAMIPFPTRFVIFGGGGGDHLTVSGEIDRGVRILIRGGDGDDRILLSSDNGFPARVWGNQGNDFISIRGSRLPPQAWNASQWAHLINVHGNAGNDSIEYSTHYHDRNGPNALSGYARLFGDAGDDFILGGQTFDRLQGGGGDDTLMGEGGGDLLIGGKGNDHLIGGPGDDVIHQNSPPWSLQM